MGKLLHLLVILVRMYIIGSLRIYNNLRHGSFPAVCCNFASDVFDEPNNNNISKEVHKLPNIGDRNDILLRNVPYSGPGYFNACLGCDKESPTYDSNDAPPQPNDPSSWEQQPRTITYYSVNPNKDSNEEVFDSSDIERISQMPQPTLPITPLDPSILDDHCC